MAWLTAGGCQVQHFSSRCCHNPARGAPAATGQVSRHLDSWLMDRELCRACFVRGFGDSEFAVFDGRFDQACAPESRGHGGSLDTLCDWLDVARLAVVDVAIAECEGLPDRPTADAVLLDKVFDADDVARWQQKIADRWGLPVAGGLERMPRLREVISSSVPGATVADDICHELATQFGRHANHRLIEQLASRRELVGSPTVAASEQTSVAAEPPPVVAVAFDEAFHAYFPDMLDLLEALGASVVDFSPLHDEQLPAEADVVYIGCGNTVHYARALSENHCMLSSLRKHLCSGKRMYADGGGLVYLSQYAEDNEGRLVSMVGALPAIGRIDRSDSRVEPVEVTLSRDCWLGPSGTRMRGYLNALWMIEPNGELTGYLGEPRHEFDLVGRFMALGSRLQLNFATRMDLLRGFLSAKSQGTYAASPAD